MSYNTVIAQEIVLSLFPPNNHYGCENYSAVQNDFLILTGTAPGNATFFNANNSEIGQ